jgi:hypothetical protein
MTSVRTLAIIVSFFAISLPAASQTFEKPIDFSNYIADCTDTLYDKGKRWGARINVAMQTKKFDTLTSARIDGELYVQKKIKEFKVMKDLKGSGPLRMAYISLLEFEAKLMRDAFIPFESFDATTSDKTLQDAIKNLTTIAALEEKELDKVRAAQLEYAKLNGFTIETKGN